MLRGWSDGLGFRAEGFGGFSGMAPLLLADVGEDVCGGLLEDPVPTPTQGVLRVLTPAQLACVRAWRWPGFGGQKPERYSRRGGVVVLEHADVVVHDGERAQRLDLRKRVYRTRTCAGVRVT